MLFYIYTKISQTIPYFSNIHYNAKFQKPTLTMALVSLKFPWPLFFYYWW